MKRIQISKDEARVLAAALSDVKHDYANMLNTKEDAIDIVCELSALQERLDEFAKDKRRNGRTTQNDFTDLLKRLVKKHNSKVL